MQELTRNYDALEVPQGGRALLDDPMFNKGTAFTQSERVELGLAGLLPPKVSSIEQQAARVMANYAHKATDLERYIHLMSLLDRNETLFHRVLLDHLEEMMPIVYTPTVGLACQKFGQIFRRPRGLYLTPADIPRMDTILAAWPNNDVKVIVVTDGERILGLGDLGASGMGIPIGKLALYVVAAGIHPSQTLPVCLDVGTDNEAVRNDPFYLGQAMPRQRGELYDSLVASFVGGVRKRFPKALVQFEDVGVCNSFRLLDRFSKEGLCFNDDIQGTGAVTLGALLAGMRLSGQQLGSQRVVIAGAGSAGVGIARQIKIAAPDAQLWLTNSKGLVTPAQATEYQAPFARTDASDFLSLCQQVRPTVLIGVSGQRGLFNRDVIGAMAGKTPMVFPLSNPTDHSECTPDEVRTWTGGNCMVATGSPFANTPQCNNVYIFPGMGLGLTLAGATSVSDVEFVKAAKRLSELSPESLLPPLKNIRKVSAEIARAVGAVDPESHMWEPRYPRYSMKK